jgi:hypothetical protein
MVLFGSDGVINCKLSFIAVASYKYFNQIFETAMKKIFITCILSLLATFAAQAQVNFGPKGALNYSRLITESSQITSSDYITGYQAGAFARFNFVAFYIQPELYVSGKGGRFTVNDPENGASNMRTDVRFTTMDFPVLAGLYLVRLPGFNARVMAGPMISATLNTNDGGLSRLDPRQYRYADHVWGAQAGIGVDISRFTADFRYEHGLSRISPALGQRPSIFMLSVGYKIF